MRKTFTLIVYFKDKYDSHYSNRTNVIKSAIGCPCVIYSLSQISGLVTVVYKSEAPYTRF